MICGLTITLRKHKCIITVNQMTMRYNSVMYKVNNGTRLFIRFLREKGIKYIYIEETLRDSLINDAINNKTDGDLLKYFDKFFSYGDNLIGYSFTWSSTKNGHEFWRKMFAAWADYLRAYSAYINR